MTSCPKRSDADYAAEFRHELEEAVRIRLRADVPVGVYLSGGLDSCAVLGLAAKHHPEPIRAFTLTFEQAAYDEGPIAKEMAALAGAEFNPIPIGQRASGRKLCRRHCAGGDALRECARRGQVSVEPGGARCRL